MLLQIRKAMKTDSKTLLSLMEEARKYKLSLGDDSWGDYPFTEEDVKLRLKVDRSYLAYVDGKVAGSITLLWDDEHNWGKTGTDRQAGYIHSLMVSDSFRGQKVGEQMITWALQQIASNNRNLARLDCPAMNRKLCGYYEKLGFKRVNARNGTAFYELMVQKN